MLRDIDIRKSRPLHKHPSALEQQYKTHNLSVQRKANNLNHKEMLSIKEIQQYIKPPNLKQSISNMLSHKRLRKLEAMMTEVNSKERKRFTAQIAHNIAQSLKTETISHLKAREQKNKQFKIETKIFNSEHLIPNKTFKNYSLSRKHHEYLDFGLIDLKNSLELRDNFHRKSKEQSRKNSRAHTQQSQHPEETSKVIFKRLQQLHHKQSHFNCPPADKQSLFFKPSNKELKSPGFIMRQKLSKQMYGQQRQQLKIVNELLQRQKGLNLSTGIKVKNYTNFLPKIMSIED